MANYEPCSICEEYIEGVICDKGQCPVGKMKAENERLKTMHSEMCIGLEVIKKNAYKQFGKFLIDKSKKGILYAADIPDYVLEMER